MFDLFTKLLNMDDRLFFLAESIEFVNLKQVT